MLFSNDLKNVRGELGLDYNEEFDESFGQQKQIIFDKSIKYLKENYMKNISRDDVAEYLFVSKSFVDKLYKQKMGKTFCEYLFEVRMAKAIELLNMPGRISEISQKVGYMNHRHFLKIQQQPIETF